MLHFTLSKLTFTLCISLDSSKQLKQFNDVLFKGRVDNLIKRQGQKVSGHMLPRDLVCRSRGLLILTKEIVLHRFHLIMSMLRAMIAGNIYFRFVSKITSLTGCDVFTLLVKRTTSASFY